MTATTIINRTIDAVWRIESPRLIAGLARIVRDVGVAEELAQDALVAALEQWPSRASRTIRAPGSWPRRSIARSTACAANKLLERKHDELGRELEARQDKATADLDARARRRRRRRSAAPHLHRLPSRAFRGGARRADAAAAGRSDHRGDRAGVSVAGATIAQRIVRAKRTLAEERVPFEIPRGAELAARLSSVLDVIYLVFNEGYTATAGDDWMRPGAVRGCAAAGPDPGRAGAAASPRCTAWWR